MGDVKMKVKSLYFPSVGASINGVIESKETPKFIIWICS